MPTNVDPTGPVPEPDASGQLLLNETKANYVAESVLAFIAGAAVLVSILYWWMDWRHNGMALGAGTSNLPASLAGIGKFGFVAAPILPFLLINMVAPPYLRVDDDGMVLRQRGKLKNLSWDELQQINLKLVVIRGRYSSTSRTFSYATGQGKRLVWAPVFGVSPSLLADYLQRRGEKQSGRNIALTQWANPSGAIDKTVDAAQSVLKGVSIAMLLVAVLFAVVAIALMLLVYGTIHNNPLAIWIGSHL